MASLVLSGDTSGAITVSAPAVSGSNTQTLVAVTGTLAPIVAATAQASTSGTSIDFTGIPSWVRRITVMFNGVSTNGTSNFLIQIGDSGGVENTNYVSGSTYSNTSSVSASSTAGYILNYGSFVSAATTIQGIFSLNYLSSNIWVASHTVSGSNGASVYGGGTKTLSDTLDRVRITTVNGTDTFDAGSINILYE